MRKLCCFFVLNSIFILIGCTAVPLSQSTKDRIAELEWSLISDMPMNSDNGYEYCSKLEYNGYSDWRLPTIDELRSIVKNCPAAELEGKCRVSEENDNLAGRWDYYHMYCNPCKETEPQEHSKLPLPHRYNNTLVSQSMVSESINWETQYLTNYKKFYWGVDLVTGGVILIQEGYSLTSVVCVREH